MKTGFNYPSLQIRPITCKSLDGFQSGSNNIILFAPIKFSPTPPAFAQSRNIFYTEFLLLNISTNYYLFLI
jgi:hypothetical protein